MAAGLPPVPMVLDFYYKETLGVGYTEVVEDTGQSRCVTGMTRSGAGARGKDVGVVSVGRTQWVLQGGLRLRRTRWGGSQ